ncbi:hypothetical protein QBD01_004966 [Ochrobactrum sp. 19YEA23]|uniref:hypothetical protein n=1 Tax=Ochrobactrum sp. 19YEA23 TaxID=3039854 RepID=UPI002478ABDB|nr:hypothetical protein [Ochrobactrum sp. 19YEA23]
MKAFSFFIAILSFFMISMHANSDEISDKLEDSVVKIDNLYYNNKDCRLAVNLLRISPILCSGIIVHGKEPPESHAWIPNINDPRNAVSFSYLRYDIPTTELYDPSGYIYDQQDQSEKAFLQYYCIYPFDSFSAMPDSHSAASHGCGFADTQDKAKSFSSCPDVSITTADAFINKYVPDGVTAPFVPEQCSFEPNKMDPFLTSIDVQIKTKSIYWNELITSIWTEEDAKNLPIIAFFYLFGHDDGRKNALEYQKDYCEMYGKFIPVVSLDLTKTVSGAIRGDRAEQQPCM